MTTRISHGPLRAVWAAVLLYAAAGVLSVSDAQVPSITSSGLGTTVSQTGTTWNITGGTRPENGSNLFHSFGLFSIGAGNTARFNNTTGPGVANILSRVTGGQPSQIFGIINTSTGFPGANFYLLNPAGILFGRNAQLDVGGSFHATTADYIRLNDGNRFNAVPSGADALLTVAAPSAFGFLTSNPAPIDVQTGVFNAASMANPFTNRLQVPVGRTLLLVGGPVNVGAPSGQPPAGFVFAPGGVVNIASVASPGEATLAGGINVDGFAKLGKIRITGGAVVDGREINIRGGRLEITDATLFPGLSFQTGMPVPPNGGQVSIHVTDDVTITGKSPIPTNRVVPGIQTFAGSTGVQPLGGDVPGVNIEAGRFSMLGTASIVTNRFGSGNAPTVVITADTIEVRNGAFIAMSNMFGGGTFSTGGGTLTINGNNMTISSGRKKRPPYWDNRNEQLPSSVWCVG